MLMGMMGLAKVKVKRERKVMTLLMRCMIAVCGWFLMLRVDGECTEVDLSCIDGASRS